jgi:pimeloyl-ACP methyl ester carboxylesterase
MKNIFLFLLLFPFLSFSQTAEREVSMNFKDWDFKGTLLTPSSEKVVLIISGSGPTDRDGNSTLLGGKNNSLKYLAETLDSLGIASLRYDKRGLGQGGAPIREEDLRFQDFVNDALAWTEYLKEKENFKEVWIAGHSEGALIGLLAASTGKIDGFISLAGSAFPLDQTLRDQLANLPDTLKNQAYDIIDQLKVGQKVEQVPPVLASLFRPSVQPFLMDLFTHNPIALIKELDMPLLIVQGGRDLQVPSPHGQALSKARPDASYVFIEDMNHVLKSVEDSPLANQMAYVNPTLPLHPALKKAFAAFFSN